LFLLRINSDDFVSHSFDWLDDSIKERATVYVQNLAKVKAERFGDRQQNADVKQ
jgi:hypothetical protein